MYKCSKKISSKLIISVLKLNMMSVLFLCSFISNAQTVFTIVDGSSEQDVGFNLYYNYSYSQTIYTQAQINNSGTISAIQFEYDGYSSGYTRNITIYMGHTSKSSFSSNSDWISNGSLTQVFSGNYTVGTNSGWYSITLDNTFTYNNSDNLVIAIDDNTGSYESSNADFYHKDDWTDDRAIYYRDDGTNPNPASPPTASGTSDYALSCKLTIATGVSISYSASTFCQNGSDPSPTLTNNAGSGTYSSSAGLSINSGSGQIDVSASTAGAYTVTYTDTDSETATFGLTISSGAVYVNDNSTTGDIFASAAFDGSGTGTPADPYGTLSDGISNMPSCGSPIIYVDAGTYTDDLLDLTSSHDGLSIIGAGMEKTIFDQSGSGIILWKLRVLRIISQLLI